MTVSELIEELHKFPGHHRVFVEHEIESAAHCGVASDYAAIQDVKAAEACTVIIDSVRSMA
jgi:hypothetical protein